MLQARLFSIVEPKFQAVHFLGGPTGAVKAGQEAEDAAAAYSKLLMEGPIDIACIGIGENGHIAFNDPPICDFNDPVMVKTAELDEMCRMQVVTPHCADCAVLLLCTHWTHYLNVSSC